MRRKILLGLVVLLVLAGLTLFLLDFTGVYTFSELREQGFDLATRIPFLGEFLVYRERNQQLNQRVEELESELEMLEEDKQELADLLDESESNKQEYEELVDELEEELATRETDAEERKQRVERLANIYSAMNPQSVVEIMEEMDISLVIDVLEEMDDEIAAEIFELMPSDMAAEVSRRLSNILIE